MTRLHVFSDLHLEIGPWTPPSTVTDGTLADIVLLAGDIHTKRRAVGWAAKTFMQPVVMIGGNHESYNGSLYADIAGARAQARMLSSDRLKPIHFLERESVIVGGVRFIGATLWTDYRLYGDQEGAIAAAERCMNDHRLIRIYDPANPRRADGYDSERVFLPEDALRIHRLATAYIESELSIPFAGKTVVITHHAPSEKSVSERFGRDNLNPAFASNLEWLMEKYSPALWVHGHTHTPFDYKIGETRVVCNPRGYVEYGEKTGFDEALAVEV